MSNEEEHLTFKLTFKESFEPQLAVVSSSLFASRSNNITAPVSLLLMQPFEEIFGQNCINYTFILLIEETYVVFCTHIVDIQYMPI